jgi:hypothetical protein
LFSYSKLKLIYLSFEERMCLSWHSTCIWTTRKIVLSVCVCIWCWLFEYFWATAIEFCSAQVLSHCCSRWKHSCPRADPRAPPWDYSGTGACWLLLYPPPSTTDVAYSNIDVKLTWSDMNIARRRLDNLHLPRGFHGNKKGLFPPSEYPFIHHLIPSVWN